MTLFCDGRLSAMKSILLLAHDDAGQEARLRCALDLTRALAGHLTCVDVTVIPPLLVTDFINTGGTSLLLTQEKDREAANRTLLKQRLRGEDVAWDWIDAAGDPSDCLRRVSTFADVIVVSRELDDFPVPGMGHVAGELVVRTGRPVLAVPPTATRLELGRALVAWDGSVHAACALRAAVPLLRRALRVVLLEVMDGSVQVPAEDAALYLSRYDVPAELKRVGVGSLRTDAVVLEESRTGMFDYVVMGGFGQLQLVERLFGGVTRTMLTKSPLPLFLAH